MERANGVACMARIAWSNDKPQMVHGRCSKNAATAIDRFRVIVSSSRTKSSTLSFCHCRHRDARLKFAAYAAQQVQSSITSHLVTCSPTQTGGREATCAATVMLDGTR